MTEYLPTMAHRSSGVYRLFELPGIYETFQRLLGARRARRRFVAEFLRPFEGARLLDAGCGTASLLDDLPAGVEYTGFDINAKYIDAARRRYGSRGRFFVAPAGGVTVEEGAFDFVVAKAVLHHLSDDEADRMLASASRFLTPGGVFVSTDPVFHEGQAWFARLLASFDRGGNVRTPDAYRALAASHFVDVEGWLVTDMLSVPYSHYVMRGVRQPQM